MINVIKRALMSLSVMGLLLVPVVGLAGEVSAQAPNCTGIQNCVGEGIKQTDPNAPTDAGTRVNEIIRLVINIFSLIVGVVAVIMIIIGGLKYITSGGDSGNITSAKNTILYAIIGLVIVALAQIIVRFVLQRVTGNTAI